MGLFELTLLSRYPSASSLKEMTPTKLIKKRSKVDYLRIDSKKATESLNLLRIVLVVNTVKTLLFLKQQRE